VEFLDQVVVGDLMYRQFVFGVGSVNGSYVGCSCLYVQVAGLRSDGNLVASGGKEQ